MPAISDRTESLFAAAVELSADRRAVFLDRECSGDENLRQQLEALLRAHDRANHLLDQPLPKPAGLAATSDHSSDLVGTVIAGRYKLLEEIGEGGMGTVWVAEQFEPVRRKVAVKLIKAGMDSKAVLARFEAERQALAVMDHPNIAKVLDGGLTEAGRPFFVMEYVKGVPITDYCDLIRLNIRERLNLFVQVCAAVQHAHQKGIIHRDLKPSNILVAPYDDRPVPKVIDFGLAKALHQRLTDRTLHTAHETVLGTPLYMSPEQAQLNNLDVDTRSDIYSLGVLLYELLTGTTPFENTRLKEAAWDEIRRIIRDEEPPRPSTRLSSTGTLPSLAACRQTEPIKLTQQVRGELDWIVMKSLEKDRTRRYETASSFAADVGRYLRDEQVEACPPTTTYRLRKFLHKHRAGVLTAAMVALTMLLGTLASYWQAYRAARAEQRAVIEAQLARQAKEAEADQRRLAQESAQTAIRERNSTLAAKEELRHTIYATDMAQVQAAGESRQFARVAQLLDVQRPAAGQPDLRGFEWHYWQRRLQRGRLRSVEISQLASTNRVASNLRILNRNATRLAAVTDYPDDSPSRSAFGGLVTIIDCLTGRELIAPFDPFPDQQQPGVARGPFISMSDDGTRLAAVLGRSFGSIRPAEQVGRLSIRDGDTGAEIRSMEFRSIIGEIALTADGSRIAVEFLERTQTEDPRQRPTDSGLAEVKVWDTATGELVQTLPMLPWTAFHSRILWSPDGARLLRQSVVTEMIDGKQTFQELFQVVDVASGEELWAREFPRHATAHRAWSWSPDGKLIVIFELAEARIAAKNNAQLWDSYTGKTLAILDREAPSNRFLNATIDFSPDSRRLALATAASEIYVWDLPELPLASNATPLHIAAPHLTLQTPGSVIQAISFSADGRELVSLDAGNSIVTWDATAREETGVGPDGLPDFFLAAISADATKIAFSGGDDRNPMSCVWDLAKNQEVFRLRTVGSFLARPGFSADGRRVALVQPPSIPKGISEIRIYDTQTGQGLSAIPVDQTGPSFGMYVTDPVFRPDGGQIAALIRSGSRRNPQPARLMAWDVATGKPVFSVTVNAMFAGWLVYGLDGKSLVLGTTGQTDSAAVFYDAATGERQRSIPMPGSPNTGVYVNIRHQIFASFEGSDALFWNLATGQERLRLRGYADINDSAFSPDGSRVAVGRPRLIGGGESELTLWSLKTGRQLLALKRPGTIETLSFSPDGNRLVAVFQQSGPTPIKPIQVWDATPLPEKP